MPKSKAPRRSKNFQKSVTEIVRKELQEELEEKVAVIGRTDVAISTPAIPNGNVVGSTNFISLMPTIIQGTGQYNERMGNELRLKYIDLKMLLHYKNVGMSFFENSSIGVRVMILRQKDQGSFTGLLTDFQGNKLLENGAVIAPGPGQFFGNTFNLLQKINREQFSVRYDKVHYMSNPFKRNDTGGELVYATPPRPKAINHKLSFGKKGLKLTYGNSGSSDATNFPYIMVVGYASTVAGTLPDNGVIAYSYSANAAYTDA